MTMPRRTWLRILSDPEVVRARAAAAEACMAVGCTRHDPADCLCPEQAVTPIEFDEWINREIAHTPPHDLRQPTGHRFVKANGSVRVGTIGSVARQ